MKKRSDPMSAKSLDENTPKFHSELLNRGCPSYILHTLRHTKKVLLEDLSHGALERACLPLQVVPEQLAGLQPALKTSHAASACLPHDLAKNPGPLNFQSLGTRNTTPRKNTQKR